MFYERKACVRGRESIWKYMDKSCKKKKNKQNKQTKIKRKEKKIALRSENTARIYLLKNSNLWKNVLCSHRNRCVFISDNQQGIYALESAIPSWLCKGSALCNKGMFYIMSEKWIMCWIYWKKNFLRQIENSYNRNLKYELPQFHSKNGFWYFGVVLSKWNIFFSTICRMENCNFFNVLE